VRYIYFERYKLLRDNKIVVERRLENMNILSLRPDNLNSYGYWGFTNYTVRKDSVEIVIVEQF